MGTLQILDKKRIEKKGDGWGCSVNRGNRSDLWTIFSHLLDDNKESVCDKSLWINCSENVLHTLLPIGDLQDNKERGYVYWFKRIDCVDCLFDNWMEEKWIIKS